MKSSNSYVMLWRTVPWSCVLVLAMASMVWAQPPARNSQGAVYSYDHFAKWLSEKIPDLNNRPAHFILIFDQTDTVGGEGITKDVLPNIWRELLGNLFKNFMVEGRTEKGGDRISILGYGRKKINEVVWQQPYRRTESLALKEKYPQPLWDTPQAEQGTDLNAAMNAGLEKAADMTHKQNIVVLLFTDDIIQGEGALGPLQAKDYQLYEGRLQPGRTRKFTAYLYWNNFPDKTEFIKYNPLTQQIESDPRTERVPAQESTGGVAETQGTTQEPPDMLTQQITEDQRKAAIVGFVGLAGLLALWGIGLEWWRAHYKVRIGGLDKTIWVFPTRRPRRIAVPQPELANQNIGILQPKGLGLLGLHQLTLHPDSKYVLEDARKNQARRGATRGTKKRRWLPYLTLLAGVRDRKNNLVAYSRVNTPSNDALPANEALTPTQGIAKQVVESATDSPDQAAPSDSGSGQINLPVLRKSGFSLGGLGGRRSKAKKTSRGMKTGQRSNPKP